MVVVRLGRWRALRWSLVALLLVGAVIAWLVGPPEVCREAVAGSQVVTICEPISVASPVVLLGLLLIGLLLVPDLAEVQIAGVLGLRRDVEEARAALAVTQRQVAEMQVASIASSRADAESVAEVESHVHVHVERQAETAAAVQAARAGGPTEVSRTGPGGYALAALHAGMLGLAGFFPAWCGPVQVLGLSEDPEQGWVVTHDWFGVRSRFAERAVRLMREPGEAVAVDIDDEAWVAGCLATDDDGRVVGALAVVLDPQLPTPQSGDLDLAQDRMESLAAAVETAARTYARLLVDLLGERGRGTVALPSTGPMAPPELA